MQHLCVTVNFDGNSTIIKPSQILIPLFSDNSWEVLMRLGLVYVLTRRKDNGYVKKSS